MLTNDRILTVMDLGSAYVRVLAAEVRDGAMRYRGHASVESRGVRKGAVVELEKAAHCIHRAIELAEVSAGATISRVSVGIGGPQMRGLNSRGGVSISSRPREIHRDDVKEAVERARNVQIPA